MKSYIINRWKNLWLIFRKFGFDYDDFPTMLSNVAFLLNILTLNIYKQTKHTTHGCFYILTIIGGSAYFYVYIISTGWLVFFRYGRADIQSAIIVFALSSCNVTCLTKFVFMKAYSKQIKNIIDKFLQCDTLVIPNTRFAKNLRTKLRIVKKRATFIWTFLMSIGVIYISIPLFIPGRHFTTDIFILFGLEPMTESPNYEIATLILTVGIGYGVFAMVAVAAYVIIVVGYNEAQMHALSDEVRSVWDDSNNFYNHIKERVKDKTHAVYIKEQIMNEFTRIRLKDVVQFHVNILNLVHELDNELRPTLAVEYGITSLSVIAGLLAGLENSFLQLPYAFAQIFMDCLAGQSLIDACDNFADAIYCCKWENFNKTNRKTVLLMLVMSQKTMTLSIGGMAKLSFNCFLMILRSTYSTYTTLKSVVKK